MIALLALAWADPPEGVDPDDLDRWEPLADAALNGPAGCWELAGPMEVNAALHTKASMFQRASETPYDFVGTWTGRLEDGTWTRFAYDLTSVKGNPQEFPIYPVIGKIDPNIVTSSVPQTPPSDDPPSDDPPRKGISISLGDDGEVSSSGGDGPFSLLRKSIDGWNTSTALSSASWSEARREIRLEQEVPTEDAPNAPVVVTTTTFPEGAWPARVSTVFPRRLAFGTWPLKVHVYDAQFHLVQQQVSGVTLPSAENMSAVGSAVGFTVSYEQRLDYRTAKRCSP